MSTKPKPYKRKPYKQYSREFKLEAIRLAEVGDKTASLRKENLRLKEENDILKKAAIYFARESK